MLEIINSETGKANVPWVVHPIFFPFGLISQKRFNFICLKGIMKYIIILKIKGFPRNSNQIQMSYKQIIELSILQMSLGSFVVSMVFI